MSAPPVKGIEADKADGFGACRYLLGLRLQAFVSWRGSFGNLIDVPPTMKVATKTAKGNLDPNKRSPAPSIPRLPFSSPVDQEILSPISPNPLDTSRPMLGDRAMDQPGLQDGLLKNRAYSGKKKNTANRSDNPVQEKGNNVRSRWPHALNLVTNFSKPPQLAEQAGGENRRLERNAVDPFRKGHRRMNSSADINTPDAYERRDGSGDRSRHKVDDQGYDTALGLHSHDFEVTRKAPSPPKVNKGPVNSLKRASTKMSTLSPFDRPIVIGISIPSDKLDQHTLSPDAGPTPISISSRQYARDRRLSDAPTVVITPAKVESSWSEEPYNQLRPGRRRAPSSLYSRATNARGTPKQAHIPPIPTRPRRSPSASSNTNPRGIDTRINSAYTIFDEDDSLREASRDRPNSGDSQLRILKRSSTDSIATRHRSQGWWNHIVSPFLPKPGAVPWRSTSKTTEPVPDLPELAPNTPLIGRQQSSDHHSLPDSRRSSSGHTSIWTDFSTQEVERQPADITRHQSPLYDGPRALEDPEKDLSEWFEGLGAAAEYHHACWHDQNHSTPYFDCQNHVCIPRRLGNFPVPSDAPGSRGLLEGAGDNLEDDALIKRKDSEASGFQQTPANRFSAAFKEALSPKSKARGRPLSETTEIEDVDATPVVQEAKAAPIIRVPPPVPAIQSPPSNPESEPQGARSMPDPPIPPRSDSKQPQPAPTSSPATPLPPAEEASRDIAPPGVAGPAGTEAPPKSPLKVEKPAKRFVAVLPPDHPLVTRASPLSPSPASPFPPANEPMSNQIPLSRLPQGQNPPAKDEGNVVPTTIINHYHPSPQRSRSDQVTLSDMEPPPRPRWSPEEVRVARENEKDQPKNTNKQHRACPPKLPACLGRGKPKTKKQKWLLIGITSALVSMIILILLLAMLLAWKGDNMEVQSQWLNLTGFPPMPTGISTVIQPDPVQESSACIHPATLWSCGVPKEQQASIAPNNPDQPNFRLEIRFQNGSLAGGGALNSTSLQQRSNLRAGNVVRARGIIKSRFLHVRDFTSNLFTPSPTPPTREDQIFLGNTTDKNQQPFDGEATPFFVSFMDPKKLPSLRMMKRAPAPEANTTTNGTDQFPDLKGLIPPPSTSADGTASPALLYPLASAQPLRLYDRDTDTEHYGFYTYFDRSIFLKSSALINFTTNSSPSEIPEDENGGAEENAAKVRCTWAQTRFLVQIWTRKGILAPLLQSGSSDSSSAPGSQPRNLTESSANNFTRPGSFPYPVSISLDRHGGDIKKKMIYCYALDAKEHIISDQKQIQLEDRGFGGTLVNPARGVFGDTKASGDEGGPGGIDGGDGGCGCRWENFSGGKG
ncbi:MAG: hypothetical protein L6R39_004728 [Caloplaca ligustica]|nr:MAG: hypothetical protein L6R39_004728 [Caloplaca ligustica]